ncbi:MAG: ribonuclease III, partial [Eubacterium sp.]|nr:ribonuclease III [Eubacterium sp.]
MNTLEQKIEYSFKNRDYLTEALTHSSYANENPGGFPCNERMEFLGDAVLSIISAEYLYTKFPKMPEGRLTKLRSSLVCTQSLSAFARELELGSYLKMGKGETASGGADRPSVLEDAFEALIAAIYLDGGMD